MIDKEKIPESTYKEMVELFGQEKAEKIIIDNHYNFRAISNVIIEEQIVRFLRIEKLRDIIIKKTRIPAKHLLLILIIAGSLLYIFWPFRL
ncbi:hypothetical protein SLH46_11750 [Draconibacterium sp. IB214405]|jgi:hypothetical protein|uniref:hypothetical protein n=1 Tax=Draconibacterium sp. IB214405 TaxID=3097352 RepID=UPI002A152583|nr:hypothetical protein [Draconibacterium sp. IB214405]MDX8339862.1 hypothetical protein [Draconibacterium sp. IB214405]